MVPSFLFWYVRAHYWSSVNRISSILLNHLTTQYGYPHHEIIVLLSYHCVIVSFPLLALLSWRVSGIHNFFQRVVKLKILPQWVKTQYLFIFFSDFIQTTFFYPERFLKKLADDKILLKKYSSITKGSIYHIKHYVHTIFYHTSGLSRNWVFNGSIYYVLYLQILRSYLVAQNFICGGLEQIGQRHTTMKIAKAT